MNRRHILKIIAAAAATGVAGLPQLATAATQRMVTVVKIAGIPWFGAVEKGLQKGGADNGFESTMVGPTRSDAAQQVKLLEDLIAQKVDIIGLVPLDVKATEPVLARAQAAGIPVICHEGPDQNGRTWNVELIESKSFGEQLMKSLAREMGEEGEYVMFVGTLTTPLHNLWADAAVAYQEANYPKMKLAADRFPGADEVDTTYNTTLDVLKAYPNLRGIIGFGSGGPVGAGNAIRERRLQDKIAIVGVTLPSQVANLIKQGVVREAIAWNPIEAGYAMASIAKMVLDETPIIDGMDVPGLGKASVDVENKRIVVEKLMYVNKQTIDDLLAQGL